VSALVTRIGGSPAPWCSRRRPTWFDGRKYKSSLAYAQAKYFGALWMASLARQHPGIRFITMSPGNTVGTEASTARRPRYAS
jgi:nucleoside-diphosphate-sugar epimerase